MGPIPKNINKGQLLASSPWREGAKQELGGFKVPKTLKRVVSILPSEVGGQ